MKTDGISWKLSETNGNQQVHFMEIEGNQLQITEILGNYREITKTH